MSLGIQLLEQSQRTLFKLELPATVSFCYTGQFITFSFVMAELFIEKCTLPLPNQNGGKLRRYSLLGKPTLII